MNKKDKYYLKHEPHGSMPFPVYIRGLRNGHVVAVDEHGIHRFILHNKVLKKYKPITKKEYDEKFEETLSKLRNE